MSTTALTFGCRLNAAESRVMQARAAEAGLEDAILVNTCAVTAEAVRQARQAIRRARREHPEKPIIVAGCAAQIEPATFAAMPEVDLVLGNHEKLSADAYRHIAAIPCGAPDSTSIDVIPAGPDAGGPRSTRRADVPGLGMPQHDRILVGDIMAVTETAAHLVDGFAPDGDLRARAFIEVQNGCDHRCTFCIIPYGRGHSRSVPAGAVVEAVRRIAARGVNEVVLTGVDITAWGADLPGRPKLGSLVRAILKHVPELPRLRLTSIDSVEADPALLRAVAEEERLMPHLHLSLQAGDDMILKRMKRRHSRADAVRFCAEVRRLRPDVVLGADLIAGFPTETDAMFANSLRLVEECGLTLLHVFPFSPRRGTPAARMPQLPRRLVHERAQALRRAGEAALAARLAAEVGRHRAILVEKPGFGRTEHYLPVMFDGGIPGGILSGRIAGTSTKSLMAHVIPAAA